MDDARTQDTEDLLSLLFAGVTVVGVIAGAVVARSKKPGAEVKANQTPSAFSYRGWLSSKIPFTLNPNFDRRCIQLFVRCWECIQVCH